MKSVLRLAQIGLDVEWEQDEEKRRVEEEKRRIEEEKRRIEEAKAELEKERDGILSDELKRFFCFVQNHLRENDRLLRQNSLSDLFLNSVEKGEEGIYMENAGSGLVKVTTTFTVDPVYIDTLLEYQG
jgi:hypothetical protein